MSRNNVRAFNQGDNARATPQYNSSILEDMFLEENTDFVMDAFHEWKTLGDALLLLKVWARNRTSIFTCDCLSGYLISIIISYLAIGPGGNPINKSMNAMQIFSVTLKFISSSLWEKGLSLKPLGQSKLSKQEMIHFLQSFSVVLCDATGHANLLFRMTRTAFEELQDEAAWTVNCIDKCKGGGFEEVFMTKIDLAAKFDACLRINLKGNAKVRSSDFCLDTSLHHLQEALKKNERLLGSDHIQTAVCYHELAIAFNCMGAYKLSIQHEKKTYDILVKQLGEDDTAFEKQSALFALAISDIVLINIWCHLEDSVQNGVVPGFGKKLSSILDNVLTSYDMEAVYFDDGVRTSKRQQRRKLLGRLSKESLQIRKQQYLLRRLLPKQL